MSLYVLVLDAADDDEVGQAKLFCMYIITSFDAHVCVNMCTDAYTAQTNHVEVTLK